MATLLLITIFLPLAGAVGIWPIAKLGGRGAVRWWALAGTLLTFGLACGVACGFYQQQADGQYFARTNWPWLGSVSGLDIRFAFALDGISLWLFALSALLMITAVLVSWTAIKQSAALFYAMLLLLETGCLGVFTSQDILLFYVFFEFTLIPLFFLIGVWGSEQRRYAAIKFFIFTLAGSVLTFLGLLTIVFWAAGYIGVAGAWNSGARGRLKPGEPLPLSFNIEILQRRLNDRYDDMLASSDFNADGRLSFVEMTTQVSPDRADPSRIVRARAAYEDALWSTRDDDGNRRFSRAELIAGQSDEERDDTDVLYESAFFRAHDADGDNRLTAAEMADSAAPETQLELLADVGFKTDKLQNDEQALGDWGLDPDELAVVDADKLAAATGWQLAPADLARVPTQSLARFARWTFTPEDARALDFPLQMCVFLALFIGFAIKVPLFPLHTWLPLAHVQAPTAGSVFLAGILLKIGAYGFLRFSIPMLPEATAAAMPWLLWLSVAGIIYGALVALAQSDIKKLIAYSSVSHLGFCMLGLFALNALGAQGALLQMVNHGISTGALFAIVGMMYERYHTRRIKDLGGLARAAPWLAFFMVLFTMSSIGLPGLNGFAGEFLILIGMFDRGWADAPLQLAAQYKVISVVAVAGVVLGAWYMLWLVQRVFFGPLKMPQTKHIAAEETDIDESPTGDLTFREIAALAPLAVLVVWIGLWPAFFLQPMAAPLEQQTAAAREQVDAVIDEQAVLAAEVRPPETTGDPPANGRAISIGETISSSDTDSTSKEAADAS